jgi:hypothetical protein
VALIREVAHEMMDRWLVYVDVADIVPAEERAAVAQRDLIVRKAIAERDPANPMANMLFGDDLANRLVRGLWGGDRMNPRAGV